MKCMRMPIMAGIFILGLALIRLPAQPFTVLHTFSAPTGSTNADGADSHADLVADGNMLYGTTPLGGTNGYGTVFAINADGSGFTTMYAFTGAADGTQPNQSLLLSGDLLYGIAARGTNLLGYGSVFVMSTNGSNFSLVYTFATNLTGAFGAPNGGLILDGDTLYGTAYQGGITNGGAIFSLTTNGTYTPLRLFTAATDGKNPLGTLVLTNGILYGTCRNGGSNDVGTVFSITTNGENFTVMHEFSTSGMDGRNPNVGLTLVGNTLYGTTILGGTNNGGTIYAITLDGSDYTELHAFSQTDGNGKLPESGLFARGNTLYGTTLGNGSSLTGTVYAMNTDGSSFTLLHPFPSVNNSTNTDGSQPFGGVVMVSNVLYGTTSVGGANGVGTLYDLAVVPSITHVTRAGTNLVLNALNGIQGQTCYVVSSPDLKVPVNQWTDVATNQLSSGGNFSITATNVAGAGAQFFRLEMQ